MDVVPAPSDVPTSPPEADHPVHQIHTVASASQAEMEGTKRAAGAWSAKI